MGKVIAKRIKGMSWMARISLVLIFTLVFSTFIYQGWFKPKTLQAAISVQSTWTSEWAKTTYPAGAVNASYAIAAGTDRILLVAIASRTSSAAAQTISNITYGGQALTLAAGDGASAAQQHTYVYYLNDAGIKAASGSSLNMTITGGTSAYTWVYAAVFAGVNQTSPFTGVKNFNGGSSASSSVGPFSSALLENTNDQPIEVILLQRSSSGSSGRTITTWESSPEAWGTNSGASIPVSIQDNDGSYYPQMYITHGKIPTANITTDTSTHTASSSSTYSSMTGISLSTAPAPTVTSTSPTSRGQGATNQNITVNGTNFVSGAAVTFSGTGITVNSTTFVSATQLTANITVAATATTGARNVTVTNPDTLNSTLTNGFTVNAGPTVTSTSPSARAQGSAQTAVTITGTGFVSGATVSFGDANITLGAVTVVSATSITVPVTVGASATLGAHTVTVTNADAGVGSASVFTVDAAPAVTSTSPNSMNQGTGPTTVTITGTGFLSGATVSFNDANITLGAVTVVSATSITVPVTVASGDTTGAKNVTVTNTDGGSGTGTGVFTVNSGIVNPTVTSASPSARARGSAQTTVTITGTGFVSGATVSFNDANITLGTVTVVSATSITVPVTVGASATLGAHTVTVTNTNNGTGSASVFTVDAAPTVTSASPSARALGTSLTTVTITGTGFLSGATVSFGDANITLGAVTVVSATSITVPVTVTASATLGAHTVTVTNTDGGIGSASVFTVDADPTVTSVSPNNMVQGAGPTTVTITGTGFLSGAGVSFGDVNITFGTVTVVSATSITVPVTVGASATLGAHNVTVTNTDWGLATGTGLFTVNTPVCTRTQPTLSLAPASQNITTSGGSAVYTLTITNNDTSVCASSTFTLTKTDSNSTNFNASTLSQSSVTLAGGVTSNTITLTVSAKTGQISGTDTSSVTSSDANHTNQNSNSVSTTLNLPCTINTPTLTVTPTSNYADVGQSTTYAISVTNNDSGAGCAAVLFTLGLSDTNSTDFNASTAAPPTLSLGPGIQGTSTLTVSVQAAGVYGHTDVTTVSLTAPAHTSPPNVIATTTIENPLVHSSLVTASTKWASQGGWGVSGGMYGQFVCATCHGRNATNIKSILSSITAPDSSKGQLPGAAGGTSIVFEETQMVSALSEAGLFGVDESPYTPRSSSNRICEYCHTYDATGANGVTAHPYATTASLTNHQNADGTDCTACHKHNQGFKPIACNLCHGDPPSTGTIGGSAGLASPATGATSPASSGAHVAHVTSDSMACFTCHTGSIMPTVDNKIHIGFTINSSNVPGWGTTAVTAGSIDVISPLTNGYTWAPSSGTTLTTGGTDTCSSLYCHGGTLTQGLNTSPQWTGGASQGACGNCHGVTNSAPGTLGSHGRHAGIAAGQLSLACADCHAAVTNTSSHVSGSVKWALNTAVAVIGSNNPTYSGKVSGSTGTLAPSTTYGSCSNVYCHSNVQGATGSGLPTSYGTPTWGGPTLSCSITGGCHDPMNTNTGTGSHNKHAYTYNFGCSTCHNGAGEGTTSHADGAIELIFNGTTASGTTYSTAVGVSVTPGTAYGSCTTSPCHSQGTATYVAPNQTPTWGNPTSGACGTCHGVLASSPPNSSTHLIHVGTAAGYVYACSKCHNATVSATTDSTTQPSIISFGPSGLHLNGVRDVVFDAFNSSGSYSGATTETCSTVYCHSDGTSVSTGGVVNSTNSAQPVWTSTTITCGSCHGGGNATGQPSYANGSPKANSHASHPTTCSNCHYETTTTNTTITGPSYHANKTYDLLAGGTYSGTTVTFTYTYAAAGGSCSTVSCHSGGTYTWGQSGCVSCHSVQQGARVAVGTQFTSGNSHHVQGISVTGASCYQCHWEANADGSINPTYHTGASGQPVTLVVWGTSTTRPTTYSLTGTVTAVQYTAATQTRASLAVVNTHCLGCHNEANKTTAPFGDSKITSEYAWEGTCSNATYTTRATCIAASGTWTPGTSVDLRYSQTGTATWGKYTTYTNAAPKNIVKAYSAHGNAGNNARGWNTTNGVDGAITDTSSNVNVLCFDCHNAHGSTVTGTTTSYTSATTNGGILKDVTSGLGGYTITYKPSAGGAAFAWNNTTGYSGGNTFNPGAGLCFDCHENASANVIGPWGYNATFGATQAIISYWEKSVQWAGNVGVNPSGPQLRYAYKNAKATAGTHFGASSPLAEPNAPTQATTIKGLCTACHDPHGISTAVGTCSNTAYVTRATCLAAAGTWTSTPAYGLPLLKGTWLTSPWKEDAAPANTNENRGGGDSGSPKAYAGASTPGYHIDQNTFETITTSTSSTQEWVWPGTKKIAEADVQFGGLCLQCHAKANINPNTNNTWESYDRIHNTVKGWADPSHSGSNIGNAIHAYACSKCHTPHDGCLPRLMIQNCLDWEHRGRVASGGTQPAAAQSLSGSKGSGTGRFPAGGGGTGSSKAFVVPSGGVGPWFAGNTAKTLNQCHNVTNAGGTTYPGSLQWNSKTPW